MSGVYIKDMKMPARCKECRFAGLGGLRGELNVCWFTGRSQSTLSQERMRKCPLIAVPEHGDLIDRDKILLCARPIENFDVSNTLGGVYGVIKGAKTVIEADKEEEDNAENEI